MLLDSQNKFSDFQYITEECVSQNVVDIGHNCEPAFGTPVPLLIQVVDWFDRLNSLKIAIETSPDPNFGEEAPIRELISTTINGEQLNVGMTANIAFLPKGNMGYMRLHYYPDFRTDEGSDTPVEGHDGAITAAVTTGIDGSWHTQI